MAAQRTYLAIDLKSFYASVECVDRHLDPLTTNLVVADASRTEKTICLAVSPSLKAYKIPGRARLFEAVQRVKEVNAQRLQTAIRQKKAIRGEDGKYHFANTSFDANALNADPALGLSYIVAPPRMQRYLDVSTQIYKTYLKYVSPADIYPYSIDEVFIDVTGYLPYYHMSAHELAMTMVREVLYNTGITATAGIGTNLYLAKLAIVNEPKVSFRNGRYYVMDGQHTIEGCILLNGGEDRPILCKVYTGLTMEQEALLFAEQNGHAAPLSAGIKLRAKVVGGDAPSKAFVAATNRAGLSLNYDSMQLSDYRIGCVGTALKLYDQLGEEIYCEALRHIVEAWEGKPDSFRAAVLRGVMYFVQLYHGQYSEERLVRALSGVHPMELYRVSRDNPAKLPGWRRYVYPIYTTYNGKCRKDALPMKF